jgi:hypothetical protein
LGYRVFPCIPRDKRPLVKAWPEAATSDADQIAEWWNSTPTANIGIATDGLVVIDPDLLDKESSDPKPNPWLTDDRARLMAKAPTQRTWSGGHQYVFRQPEGKRYRNTDGEIAPHVDTRGTGGYIVAAPSFVKKGKRSGYYRWAEGCELEIEPQALPEPPDAIVSTLDSIEANRSRAKPSGGDANNCSQADRIPDGKRNSTLASMAGAMRRKGFPPEAIKAALLVVNSDRCDPPLPEADVEAIAASVGRYEPAATATESGHITFQRITAPELDAATYETEFLIEQTLVAGQPLIVAGGKKCLKTNILLDAAISLATATPMLGALKVNRAARVAVMSGESGLATIQETCRRIARQKGKLLSQTGGLIFSPDLPRIDDARHQVALAEFLTADEIEIVVLDPAYLCLPSEDNGNLFAQGSLLRSLTTVCNDVGASLVLCHHTKRTGVDPFQPPELEHIAWAGFQEFARQWWLLGRRERFDPESDGEHRLWFNVGGSAGFASLWAVDITEGKYPAPRRWEVTLARATEARRKADEAQGHAKRAREQSRLNDDVAALLDVANRYPDGETKTVLRAGAGLNSGRMNLAIASAIKSGKLTTCSITKSGKKTPIEGYKAACTNQ